MKSISLRRIGFILIVFLAALGAEVYFVYFRGDAAPPPSQSLSPRKVLEGAEEIEVLSIDPCSDAKRNEERFHGCRVLGRAVVKDRELRRVIADAIRRSIAENQGASDLCFEPRHVVRAVLGEKRMDFVICFECHSLHLHEDESDACQHFPISDAAKTTLNKILTDAGVPLAKTSD